MSIFGTPVVTVKQAAATLGLNVQTVEAHLRSGKLRGEKRQILFRDRWFVHKAQVEELIAQFYELASDEITTAEQDFSPPEATSKLRSPQISTKLEEAKAALANQQLIEDRQLQETVRLVSQEFGSCLQQSLQLINELREQLEKQDIHLLKLQTQDIPRLQRRIQADCRALQLKNSELVNQRDQIVRLQNEARQLASAKLEVESLRPQIAHLSRPWWQKFWSALNQPI